MIKRLLNWLDEATCNFLAVDLITRELTNHGFLPLRQEDRWEIHPGGKYYIVKNGTAVVAFIAGEAAPWECGCRIISAHSDSPCFKLKPNCEIYGDGGVVSLNVEKYGGGIMYTWFDRPLSLSGRVSVKSGSFMDPVNITVDFRRPIATIPHLAIHFNRAVNEGNALSVQKDMKPVLGYYSPDEIARFKEGHGPVKELIAREIGVDPDKILDYELCLYPAEKASLCGASQEYFQSARIDDLSMAFAALEALLAAADTPASPTRIMAIFDNEETGSATKQGAHSPLLRDILARLCTPAVALRYAGRGGEDSLPTGEEFYMTVAKSFMISADDAHAWHPNYNEKYDPTNHPVIGGGPVVKINANCKYMTDSDGAAVFRALCDEVGVKCQYFVNHGDVAGGSTLGNILTGQLDLRGVDMGNAIWAMHSARETAGVTDHNDSVKVFTRFYCK